MTPLTLPPRSTSKVSLLFAAPVRFSKPEKATPPTVPLSGPVMLQVESAAGPLRVSVPAPPSKLIEMPAAPSDESMVNVSSPSPPFTVTLEIDVIGADTVTPSIETETSAPETDAEIVCDEPSEAAIVNAGGASPLAVHVVGSGAAPAPASDPAVAPSDCVAGAVPVPVAPEEEPEAPAADDVQAAAPASLEPPPLTLGPSVVDGVAVIVVSSGAPAAGASDESIAPEPPVVPTVDGPLTVPVAPTVIVPGDGRSTVVCCAGADAPAAWVCPDAS